MTTTPEPEEGSPDLECYHVYSRIEIIGLLRTLERKRIFVTLYFSRGEDLFVTNLLYVNPEFEELIFDPPREAALHERLLASQHITSVAFIDHVKVQFSSQRAEPTVFEDRPAIRVRLPDSVLRLQRREYYRVPTPMSTRLVCTCEVDGRPGKVHLTVVELSGGGFGATVNPEELRAELGMLLKDLCLPLPGVGVIEGVAEVRRLSDDKEGAAKKHRLGCEFVRLSGAMSTLLQRYVNELQREQLSRK